MRSCLTTVQNTLVILIPQKHSPNGPVHTIRQIWRRLRTILQGHLESTPVPTRCIPTLTPSYIIPWCVSLATTYPQPGQVSLGTISPLLLESSRMFPVAIVSSPSTLATPVYVFCPYLKVPLMPFSTKSFHRDMKAEIVFLDQILMCLFPSCGICFSFLQRILTHQNFQGVRNLHCGRHFTTASARFCLCRRSRQGHRRLYTFDLSLLRQNQRLQETRISPLSQPLQHRSHPQSTLPHTTPLSSSPPQHSQHPRTRLS